MKQRLCMVLAGVLALGWAAWDAAEPRSGRGMPSQAMRAVHAVPQATRLFTPASRAVAAASQPSNAVLLMPVAGADAERLRHGFAEDRGGRRHEAVDILAPRGTPVRAVADGVVAKIFESAKGGLTVYQFDPTGTYSFYYAHLDGYAPGLREGQELRRGDEIGRVGTTGNAPPGTPHLHFAVARLDADRRWWGGTPVDPYPMLAGR